jgi:hypothetical protein
MLSQFPGAGKACRIQAGVRMTGIELYGVVSVSIVGTVLLVSGLLLAWKGFVARREITAELMDEYATTPSASGRPNSGDPIPTDVESIHDARTAWLRIIEIKDNLHNRVGRWQQIPPDSPDRQWFINGLAIRTALSTAVMGYGVANLAMGVGAALALAGATALGITVSLIFAAS